MLESSLRSTDTRRSMPVPSELATGAMGGLIGSASTFLWTENRDRRGRARDARVRLYDKIVPTLMLELSPERVGVVPAEMTDEFAAALEALDRTSVMAGRKEQELARRVIELVEERGRYTSRSDWGDVDRRRIPVKSMHELDQMIVTRLRELQNYLVTRVR
jgi:hypothetical protein